MYKVTFLNAEEKLDMKKKKDGEQTLKDFLKVIPLLKKHGMEGEVLKKVRTLRSGRKTKTYSLEVSRMFHGKEIKFASAIQSKTVSNTKVLAELKAKIISEIKKSRAAARPPVEDYSFSQGVTVKKLAEVYIEPGTFVKVLHKKIRLDMTKNKEPKDKDNYVGIEIEFASKKSREFICDRLWEAGLGKYVCVKSDGSIGAGRGSLANHGVPIELCILARQHEFMDVVSRACKVLNEQCEVKVDKTCGLHVHVDMRSRNVEKAFSNLVSCQNFLYSMLPAQRKNSQYSIPVDGGKKFRKLESRYYGINTEAFYKYKTLELRMHNGTTEAVKINNWTQLILSIIDAPEIARAYSTVVGLKKAIGISDELAEYVKGRISKFASQHATTTHKVISAVELVGEDVVYDTSVAEDSEAA